jgi:uncharacterized protein (TIGR02145 family)
MYCKHCGKSIDEDAIFCRYCGFKQYVSPESESSEYIRDQEKEISEKSKKENEKNEKVEFSGIFNASNRRYYEASVVGILILIWSIYYVLYYQSFRYSVQSLLIIFLILRIVLAIWAINIAYKLNRNRLGWGLFTFFLPDIALIIIGLLKSLKVKSNLKNSNNSQKESKEEDNFRNTATMLTTEERIKSEIQNQKVGAVVDNLSNELNPSEKQSNNKISITKNKSEKKYIRIVFILFLIIVVLIGVYNLSKYYNTKIIYPSSLGTKNNGNNISINSSIENWVSEKKVDDVFINEIDETDLLGETKTWEIFVNNKKVSESYTIFGGIFTAYIDKDLRYIFFIQKYPSPGNDPIFFYDFKNNKYCDLPNGTEIIAFINSGLYSNHIVIKQELLGYNGDKIEKRHIGAGGLERDLIDCNGKLKREFYGKSEVLDFIKNYTTTNQYCLMDLNGNLKKTFNSENDLQLFLKSNTNNDQNIPHENQLQPVDIIIKKKENTALKEAESKSKIQDNGSGPKNQNALNSPINNTYIDSRDGKTYKTVKIGTQTWMAENLAYKVSSGCWVYGPNEMLMIAYKYGYLYNWVTAKNVCPSGWHLPTYEEWTILIDYLGGNDVAAGKLKEVGQAHWKDSTFSVTNESGFTALPGGYRKIDGSFDGFESYGLWWSSTECNANYASDIFMRSNSNRLYRLNELKNVGYSIRCVRD